MILIFAITITITIAQFLAPQQQNTTQCYGVIMDAGSSGTRVYVYNWDCRQNQSLPYINLTENAPDTKIKPGLSTFYNNITGIPSYIQPLLDFAYLHVPIDQYAYTPIMLGATAGLRLLDPLAQAAIINEVQFIFSQSKFYYNAEWVRVISGQEEGSYLWMSIYYLLQANVKNLLTIDLGGASTQIAFPQPNTTQDIVVINIPGSNVSNYDLYAVSYLGYGNDMARGVVISYSVLPTSLIIQTPCYHSGYTAQWDQNTNYTLMGTGDMQLCIQYINQYLNVSDGESINGAYQPKITNQSIYAVSAVATMASFFQITQFTLPQFYALVSQFCSLTYDQVQQQYKGDPYAATNFFLGNYVYELLSDGYGISDSMWINAPDEIDGVTPTWTLAAMSYQLAQINCDQDSPVCQMNVPILIISFIMLMIS